MRLLACLPIVLLAGCQQSFDERYDKTEKDLRAEATGIDRELATKQPAAAQASATPSATPPATPRPPAT